MEVGEKIRRYMEDKGVSQVYVCRRTGIKPPKLNLALSCKRRLTFEEYEAICWALGVGVETFLEPKPPDGERVG